MAGLGKVKLKHENYRQWLTTTQTQTQHVLNTQNLTTLVQTLNNSRKCGSKENYTACVHKRAETTATTAETQTGAEPQPKVGAWGEKCELR